MPAMSAPAAAGSARCRARRQLPLRRPPLSTPSRGGYMMDDDDDFDTKPSPRASATTDRGRCDKLAGQRAAAAAAAAAANGGDRTPRAASSSRCFRCFLAAEEDQAGRFGQATRIRVQQGVRRVVAQGREAGSVAARRHRAAADRRRRWTPVPATEQRACQERAGSGVASTTTMASPAAPAPMSDPPCRRQRWRHRAPCRQCHRVWATRATSFPRAASVVTSTR
jgi:hypothetical protein